MPTIRDLTIYVLTYKIIFLYNAITHLYHIFSIKFQSQQNKKSNKV